MVNVGVLSHVSTYECFHVPVHVAPSRLDHVSLLSSLFGPPSRHPRASYPDHLCCRAARSSLITSSLLWCMRPCLTDIKLTDETFLILTSASVGKHAQSQAINKCEGMTSYVMMCLSDTTPNCPTGVMIVMSLLRIITAKASSSLQSLVLPLNIIKTLLSENNKVDKLLAVGFIREVEYPDWLANVVVVPKKGRKWRVCVNYTNLNDVCPKDSFPLPQIDQIVDSAVGHGMLSFLDAFFRYHQIPMYRPGEEKTALITLYKLYCYKVMSLRMLKPLTKGR